MENLITISEAARKLGRANNQRLVRFLVEVNKIPLGKAGRSDVMNDAGYRKLERAAKEWDARLRPRGRKAEAAAHTA